MKGKTVLQRWVIPNGRFRFGTLRSIIIYTAIMFLEWYSGTDGSTTLIRRSLDVHHRHTFLLDITIRFVFNQVTNIMFVTLQFNSFDKSDSSHIFSNNADLVYKIVLYYGYLALSIRNTYIFHCK